MSDVALPNPSAGDSMMSLAAKLFPICRSITGDGQRQSLKLLQQHVPLVIHEVSSGTKVFDWEVPREWNIRNAWIKDPSGRIVVDFRENNLHVVGYSVAVHKRISLTELRPHLYSLPEHPDWVPYRTSYYAETWGFCLSHRLLESLPNGEYEVCIDSTLEPGNLTFGELVIPGEGPDEVLFSAHSCHPGLANDNLSGMVVAAGLAGWVAQTPRRLTYRFLWLPGTIGSITWLALHQPGLAGITAGLVLSCLGDSGPFTYKRSRRGDSTIDRAVSHVLSHEGSGNRTIEFSPLGYDERQYCSPGIDLPVGCLMRTQNGRFPEYHTSADNLNFIHLNQLEGSVSALCRIVQVLEENRSYRNLFPMGEPQLGRRGLYRAMGGSNNTGLEQALLWVLNCSDGGHSLLDVAERSGLPFDSIARAAELLKNSGLLAVETE